MYSTLGIRTVLVATRSNKADMFGANTAIPNVSSSSDDFPTVRSSPARRGSVPSLPHRRRLDERQRSRGVLILAHMSPPQPSVGDAVAPERLLY